MLLKLFISHYDRFLFSTDGKVPRYNSRIYYPTRMRQMASTNLWIREKEGQEIFSRNSGIITYNTILFNGIISKIEISCMIISLKIINFSARKFHNNSVVQEHAQLFRVQRNAEKKWKLLFKKSQKKDVHSELNLFVNLKQNLSQCKIIDI